MVSDASLLKHISGLPHARANFKQLVRELKAKGEERRELQQALDRLVQRVDLIEPKPDQFVVTRLSREFATGRLKVHRDGYAFLISDRPLEHIQGDVFIPKDSASQAMHGDRVVVRILRVEDGGRADGEIVRILKRAHATVVGEFRIRKRGNFVVPYDDRIQQWIEIPEGMEIPEPRESPDRVGVKPVVVKGPEDMDGIIVNVEILDFPEDGESATGRVTEILGYPDDFGVDVEIMIRKHHIPHEFPRNVLEQARGISLDIGGDELAKRRDFRDLPDRDHRRRDRPRFR